MASCARNSRGSLACQTISSFHGIFELLHLGVRPSRHIAVCLSLDHGRFGSKTLQLGFSCPMSVTTWAYWIVLNRFRGHPNFMKLHGYIITDSNETNVLKPHQNRRTCPSSGKLCFCPDHQPAGYRNRTDYPWPWSRLWLVCMFPQQKGPDCFAGGDFTFISGPATCVAQVCPRGDGETRLNPGMKKVKHQIASNSKTLLTPAPQAVFRTATAKEERRSKLMQHAWKEHGLTCRFIRAL